MSAGPAFTLSTNNGVEPIETPFRYTCAPLGCVVKLIEPMAVSAAYRLGDDLVASVQGQLVWQGKLLERDVPCSLKGAATWQSLPVFACDDALLFFDQDHRVVDILDAPLGLPIPVNAVGMFDGELVLQSNQRMYVVDQKNLTAQPLVSSAVPASVWQQQLVDLSRSDQQAILSVVTDKRLSVEQLILDAHAGRLFGWLGVLVMDAVALLLMFMVFSGLWTWWMVIKRRKYNSRVS